MSKLATPVGIALLAIAVPATAVDTSVDVRANIKGTCVITQGTTIDFGDLEQGTTAPDRTQAGTVNYWCSKGLAYTVTLGNGNNYSGSQRRMKGIATTNSSEFLTYDLSTASPGTATGVGPQQPATLPLTATVKGTDYNVLSVGQFMDTVVVTFAF